MMMTFPIRITVATLVVEPSIFLLVESHRVGEYVGILRVTGSAIASADVRVRHAPVELVVGIGLGLVAQSANVEVSKIKFNEFIASLCC